MVARSNATHVGLATLVTALPLFCATPGAAEFALGPEELVLAGGSAIYTPGYSVPSLAPWDGDALPDLIVGEGGGTAPTGKVRVYLNTGSAGAPQFTGYFYAQSLGSDLVVTGGG